MDNIDPKRRRIADNAGLLLTVIVILLYAAFVQWAWGWPAVLAAWRDVESVPVALALLVATYFVRTHRVQDYFPNETGGRFFRLYRVTQIHNILNIMLPLRAGETSFPLLMRSEFGISLARGASALLVLRLLDLHALVTAAAVVPVAHTGFAAWAVALWLVLLVLPLGLWPLRHRLTALLRTVLPARLVGVVDEIDAGIPESLGRFLRAWALTIVNWAVKVAVLAWVLGLLGVTPFTASLGGALGGELSSVLPVHAPGGVGTYPAGIAAGAVLFGAERGGGTLDALGKAAVNAHLLMIVSALAGAALALVMPGGRRPVR